MESSERATPERRVIAFHFPHKCASTFAFSVLSKAAKKHRLPLFSQSNKPPNHAAILGEAGVPFDGLVLRGPVRNFALAAAPSGKADAFFRFSTPIQLLEQAGYRAVCQTRDVLDLVVSQYFSHGWIHPPADGFAKMRGRIQSGEIGIFDYALLEFEGRSQFGQESILEKYRKLRQLCERLGPANALVVRYEEMVEDYDRWASRLCGFLGDWLDLGPVLRKMRPKYPPGRQRDELFADPRSYVSERSAEMKHVRSPLPGDHRRFLRKEEIHRLRRLIDDYDREAQRKSA